MPKYNANNKKIKKIKKKIEKVAQQCHYRIEGEGVLAIERRLVLRKMNVNAISSPSVAITIANGTLYHIRYESSLERFRTPLIRSFRVLEVRKINKNSSNVYTVRLK